MDNIWIVAGYFLLRSGWQDIGTFVDQIKTQANPLIYDWDNVPVGTTIAIPFINQ